MDPTQTSKCPSTVIPKSVLDQSCMFFRLFLFDKNYISSFQCPNNLNKCLQGRRRNILSSTYKNKCFSINMKIGCCNILPKWNENTADKKSIQEIRKRSTTNCRFEVWFEITLKDNTIRYTSRRLVLSFFVPKCLIRSFLCSRASIRWMFVVWDGTLWFPPFFSSISLLISALQHKVMCKEYF